MNQYQKVYMNQIHSSSLLGQLAQMWRSQMLCDALIRTGNITTKAHRVVLVAACPMLQSMDNASVGSHLEVRLAADIKQEAVNSFLQYLYEGFMMLTEDNCKDVEKVARLLQVDSVTKCCIDFYSCLQKKTGAQVYSNTQYKYSSADLLEFRHVRTTDLQKTVQERMMKRAAADSMRPMSPSGKRQRMQQQQRPLSPNIDLAMFGQKADDTLSMAHSYMGNIGNQASDPWERVPRIGGVHNQRPQPKPGVIEIVEDSLEILQTQPPDKDGNKSAPPVIQKSLAISVSSQVNSSTDVHVVNVNDTSSHPTAATDGPIMSTGRDSITVSPLTVMPGSSSLTSSSTSSPLTKDQHKPSYDNQKEMSDRGPQAKKSQSLEQQSSTPQRGLFPVSMSPVSMSPINQVNQPKKSFAAGSASQAASMSQTNDSSSTSKRPSTSTVEIVDRPPSSDSSKELGTKSKVDDGSASNSTDMAPDLSIVKVEPTMEDPGLDMYVDVPDDSILQAQHRDQREHDDESDLELEEASGDWSRDEMSNEAGGSDQNNSWYIGQFKGNVDNTKAQKSQLQPGVIPLKGSRDRLSRGSETCGPSLVKSDYESVLEGGLRGAKVDRLLKLKPLETPMDAQIRPSFYTTDSRNRSVERSSPYDSQSPTKTTPHCGENHIPVNMQGVRKGCVYCQLTKSKTRSGYWVYTRYKCGECEVPLCMPTAERDCFQLYHKYLTDGSLQPPKLFPDSNAGRQHVETERSHHRQAVLASLNIQADSSGQSMTDQTAMTIFQNFPWQPPLIHAISESEKKNEKFPKEEDGS